MKKLLAVFILGTLVACGVNPSDDNANNDYQAAREQVFKEQAKVPISNIENIFYETRLKTNTDTKHIYIEKLTEQKQIDNHTYNNFILYLADQGEKEATIIPEISIIEQKLANIDELAFDTIEVEGASILIAIHPIDSENNEIFALGLSGGTLVDITFEDKGSIESLASDTVPLKVLKDKYIQTLSNNGEGFIFTTWSFDEEAFIFINYDQTSYVHDKEEIEVGNYFADHWLTFDDYFLDFPYYTFTEEDKDKILEGYLADLPNSLGTPISEVIKDYTIYDEGYYDGGPYFETRDGMLFYNEATKLHSVAFISGNRIKNDYEIEDILGKPTSSGRSDMYPDEIYSLYNYDDYALWLFYNENNDLIRMELFSLKHR